MKKSIRSVVLVTFFCALFFVGCNSPQSKSQAKESITDLKGSITESETVVHPLNIEGTFIPCGWMGDGERGSQFINCEPNNTNLPHSGPTCIKITYTTGPLGWGGIYWSNKDCNWGDEPGYDLSNKGFSRITFWARGEHGGESAQFKAGGMKDKEYKDSFDCEPKLSVSLGKEWSQYTIDLRGKDLKNVIGGFCWVSNSSVTFYLDDLKYE